MTLLRKAPLPLALGALLLASGPAAVAATTPAPAADSTAVVNLTYDVLVSTFSEAERDSDAGFVTEKFGRPTSAPLPRTNPLAEVGMTITPGTTIVISVFSTKAVNDSFCVTGTSTKTVAVVYYSSTAPRPTTTRPHNCALPGHAPILAKPAKRLIVSAPVKALSDDLKTVSIGEQSYATDNNGAFVADTLGPANRGSSSDPLVMQGVRLNTGDTVVATLFTTDVLNDSYCLTATSVKTKTVVYLSSLDDTPTTHRPKGCVAPTS